jgi:hypothetical protein
MELFELKEKYDHDRSIVALGHRRYQGISGLYIHLYWSKHPDFVYPEYITVEHWEHRRLAYGKRPEAEYPLTVTEDCEYDRQVAYTTAFDKKAVAMLADENAVQQHAALWCMDDMISVLESRVAFEDNGTYCQRRGHEYRYRVLCNDSIDLEDSRAPDIEQRIDAWYERENMNKEDMTMKDDEFCDDNTVLKHQAVHTDYSGCKFIEELMASKN